MSQASPIVYRRFPRLNETAEYLLVKCRQMYRSVIILGQLTSVTVIGLHLTRSRIP